ncbi:MULTISPECIES: gene transfer agent family protein [unclassified Rhizobium]|uniref:gene transfer agent family protein n=1 Tax=unclassified Rhizobium TaxID=2613769 RepID=UPI001AE369C2|nr:MULTISPECIES: gene transfer agent family protein [unclassified Rhizobium]MBP2459586.1 hypothetical protein [Rhizobium sp. PvP014]MBP2531880.1 hypothetical protein [Rhizobium sp. PvP099]
MSRDASITLTWADGDFKFRLGWGELEELQEKTDAGPYVVLQRLHNGTWRVQDISNVIRIGLIGGGMAPDKAIQKIRFYVEQRPPMESIHHAIAVLSSALLGAPDEKLGEPKAPKRKKGRRSTASPTESSGLAPSTEQAPL